MNNNHSNSDLNSNEARKRSSRNVLRQILEAEAQNTVEHQEVSGEQEVAANEGQQNQQQQQSATTEQDTTTNTTKDTSNPSSKTQIAKRVESGNQLPIAASTPSSTISISNARTSSTSTSSRYAGTSRADSRAHFAMMQELRRMEDDDDDSKPASGTRTPTNSPETGSNDEASNHPPNIDTLPLLTPAQRRNQRVIQMRHAAMREAQHRTSRARNQLVPSGGGTVARVNPARRPVGGDRDFQRAVNRITTRLRLARQRLQSSVAVLRNLENRVTNGDDSSSDSELEFDPPPHPPVVRRFRRGANGRQQARPVRGPRPIQAAMNAGIPNAPMNREMAARHRIKRQTMLQQHATPPVPAKRNDRRSFDWPEMARFLEQRRQPPEPVLQRSFSIVRQYRPGESPTNNRNVEGPSRQTYALPTNHRLRIPLEVKRQLRVHASGRPVANDAHPAASDYIFRPPYVIQQRTTIYRLRNLESPEEETEPETAIETQTTATDDEETQGEEITGEETKDDTGMESNEDRDSTAGDGSETSTDN